MDLSKTKPKGTGMRSGVSDWVDGHAGLDCVSGPTTSTVLRDSVNNTKVSLDTIAWRSCDLDLVEP